MWTQKRGSSGLAGLATLGLLLGGCPDPDPDDTGTTARNGVEIRISLEEDDEGADATTVETLSLSVVDAVFESPEGPEGDSYAVSLPSPITVEVVSGAAVPSWPVFELPIGTYEDVEFRIDLGTQSQTMALLATGEVESVPYRLVVDEPVTLTVEAGRMQLPTGADLPVSLEFEVKKWFENGDAEALELGEDDIAEISETHNASIYAEVLHRIEEHLEVSFPGQESDDEEG